MTERAADPTPEALIRQFVDIHWSGFAGPMHCEEVIRRFGDAFAQARVEAAVEKEREALREIALLPDDHVYVRARGIAMRALNWSQIP